MRALSHRVSLRSRIHGSAVALALLVFLARTGWKGKVTNGRQFCFVTSVTLWCLVLLSFFRRFGRRCSFCLSSGLWKELFEIFKQIRSGIEEMRNLRVNVLDWFRFALVGLKNLKELFIDLWSILKSVLRIKLANVSDFEFVLI
jgi:hypothetical protein